MLFLTDFWRSSRDLLIVLFQGSPKRPVSPLGEGRERLRSRSAPILQRPALPASPLPPGLRRSANDRSRQDRRDGRPVRGFGPRLPPPVTPDKRAMGTPRASVPIARISSD